MSLIASDLFNRNLPNVRPTLFFKFCNSLRNNSDSQKQHPSSLFAADTRFLTFLSFLSFLIGSITQNKDLETLEVFEYLKKLIFIVKLPKTQKKNETVWTPTNLTYRNSIPVIYLRLIRGFLTFTSFLFFEISSVVQSKSPETPEIFKSLKNYNFLC